MNDKKQQLKEIEKDLNTLSLSQFSVDALVKHKEFLKEEFFYEWIDNLIGDFNREFMDELKHELKHTQAYINIFKRKMYKEIRRQKALFNPNKMIVIINNQALKENEKWSQKNDALSKARLKYIRAFLKEFSVYVFRHIHVIE